MSHPIEDLLPHVYDQLRAMARSYFLDERPGTLQPTAIVHEAYLRLVQSGQISWRNRAHFLGIAAQEMRRSLVDHARRRRASRRGGGWTRIDLAQLGAARAPAAWDLLALDEALARLSRVHARCGRVAELCVFAGLTHGEVAEVLCVSRKTVVDDWSFARSWLSRELTRCGDTCEPRE